MSETPAELTVVEAHLTPVLVADPPLLNSTGVHQPYAPRLILEIEASNGVRGLGETYGDTRYLRLAEAVVRALPGHRIHDIHGLRRLVGEVCAGGADGGSDEAGGLRGGSSSEKPVAAIVALFEVACLDAWGRTLGVPVHALLGGRVRDRVEFSAYLFYRWARHPRPEDAADDWGEALDPAGVVAQARRMSEVYGFRSFKLKGGVFPPAEEIAAIRALAEAFPGHPLRLDPNAAWSVSTSLEVAHALEDVLEYLEDPTTGTPRMAEVSRGTTLPLATNMCVTTFSEIPEAFKTDAVQVVLTDHHYWGGLVATMELAAICRTFGVALSMHSNTHLGISLAAMTHLGAAVPDLAYACDTHRPWQSEDVVTGRPVFREGCLDVSDAPGLGVELDREALERLHRRWLESDIRDRDDVGAMRAVHPDWTRPAWPRW
ncbi:MAG TPA: glucarate dehydratase family protein [Candidatus Dormibacteraeota bacterium]|jgi:glucarate dehydratase|nr:glucarate dehydratase family protein [Candidatus Dormibacteraeota bacterium]